MSSCQDYASRRPQEPWNYLDIVCALPLVCSTTQCIISCGRQTCIQVAWGRTLKGWSCNFFIVWLHFSHSAGANCNHIPDTADSSSLIPRPCHVVYHCSTIDSCAVVRNNMAPVMGCLQADRNGRCWYPAAVLFAVKVLVETRENLM